MCRCCKRASITATRTQVSNLFQLTAAYVMLLVKRFMIVGFVVAGNLFRTADGRLAYIDFGMMGEIEPPVRRCAHPTAI